MLRSKFALGATLLIVIACGSPAATPTKAPTQAPPTATAVVTTAPTGTPVVTEAPSPTAAGMTCDTKIKVGLVTDVGRINDKGFNQSAYEGMEAAAAEAPSCFDTDYIETQSQSDYAPNIAQFVDAGYNVIIGVGFLLGDALGDAAIANPDIKFLSVDGVPNGCAPDATDCTPHDTSWLTNGESLFFAEDQAGYLAGVLAASMSTSKHVGVVGGLVVVPPVERFVEGYINGARSVQDDIPADFVYTTSFIDPPQGAVAANQMLDAGADVIFAAGGLTGNGALGAACESRSGGSDALAIGVDTDQFDTLPEVQACLLSSATKNVKGAVHDSLLRIADGTWVAGFHTDDAATGGVGLAPFHNFDADVPQAVKDLLATTLAGLADGSISTGAVVDGQTTVPATGQAH